MRKLCLLFLMMAGIRAGSLSAESAATAEYEDLKGRYLKLCNTDAELLHTAQWRELSLAYDKFVNQNPDLPQPLYYQALLHERLYKKLKQRGDLDKSLALLERISLRHADHPLADDALLKRAELLMAEKDTLALGLKHLRQIVEQYPHTDSYEAAKLRLKAFEDQEQNGGAQQKRSGKAAMAAAAGAPLVVIDPGHGGEDYGAQGSSGLLEKDLTLSVALELERILTRNGTAAVRLTRRTDEFVPLAHRTGFANDFGADLFISLHVNASTDGKLSGLQTFYLDLSTDEASRLLAERENKSAFLENGELGDIELIVSDLIQSSKLEDSIVLAHTIQRVLVNTLRPNFPAVKDMGVRKAPFYVLVGAHMPCVLVELFFVDNPQDAAYLAQKEFRQAVAQALAHAIQTFLKRRE